jgi:hypothetical protein
MFLPDWVWARRAAYVEKFPLWTMPPGPDAEERARQWSIGFAEQIMFDMPGMGWGMKRADPTRPISKDTIARQLGDSLFAWDHLTGAGSGSPVLVDNPDSMDITGQFFEDRPEFITPQNHLGTVTMPDPPMPPPLDPPSPPVGCTCQAELATLKVTLEANMEAVAAILVALNTKIDVLTESQRAIARLIQAIPIEYVGTAQIRVLGTVPIVLKGKG